MTRLRWLALGSVLSVAHAHGPAPAALGLHGGQDAPAAWIRTNIGLAVARPEGAYSYVCPATWGSDERAPPVAQLPDGRLVIVHAAVAYVIDADGCGRAAQPMPGAGSSVAAVALDDAVYVVTREAERSTLWRIDGDADPAAIEHFDTLIDSAVASDGHLQLGAARPAAELIFWAGDFSSVERPDWDASFVAVRGGGRFARLSTDAGVVLMERLRGGWRQVARALTSVHGPVRFGEGWLMTVDGVIHQRAGFEGDFSAILEARWTCLQRVGERVFACAEFGLSEVAPDLSLTPVFGLDDLVGVDCPDAESHARCDGQWLHFGAEAGLVRGLEPEPAPEPAPIPAQGGDDDCAMQVGPLGGPDTPAGWVLILALALRRRIATLRATA